MLKNQNASGIILFLLISLYIHCTINLAEKNKFRAAVDVFPEEPVPSDAFFRKESNILFTSHVAGAMHFSYKNIRGHQK